MTLARLLLAGAALAVAADRAPPAGPPAEKPKDTGTPVSYYREVRRLFQQHCQGCHQPAKPQGGYVMTGHADLFKAGDRGVPNIVPGDPGKSHLVEQIVPRDGKRAAMPKNRDPLTPADIDLVKRWVLQGAKDDTPPSARDTIDEKHPPVYD